MKQAYKGTLRLLLVLIFASLLACGENGSEAPVYTCYPSHIHYTYPEDNETDIEGYQVIYVRFTYPMDDSTINESTFTLEDDTGNIVAGWVRFYEYRPDAFALPKAYAFFYPSGNLIPSTRYTATLDNGVQCEEGHSLGCNYSWNFTTKADDGIGFWEPVSNTGAPFEGTAVWTGEVMIVWDGTEGGQYSVDTSWQAISTIDAPSGRSGHTAVWTGSEMIVWGGIDDGSGISFNTGGKYDPFTDTWQAISTTDAPSGRSGHTAVWTGSEMIVWGTRGYTGGRYNPLIDSWQETSTLDTPSWRSGHTAVWTGSEMIVWGGEDGLFNPLDTGGRYDPSNDTWQETSTVGAPKDRYRHTAIWTGGEMIVWGGDTTLIRNREPFIISKKRINTGGVYYPDTNSWEETSTTNTPLGMSGHAAVWTNGEMIVWNGTGGRYIP